MNISPAKENILKRIRQALSHSTPMPFPATESNSPLFRPGAKELDLEFAEQFGKLLGKFIFCLSLDEFAEQLGQLLRQRGWENIYCREKKIQSLLTARAFSGFSENDLDHAPAALTTCEALVARTGTIVLSAAQPSGRTVSVYTPVHICIANTSQLVYDIKDGLQLVRDKYQGNIPSLITFATGPSRTADIEKTLVVGVHGPKEVYLFLVDEPF